MTSGAFAFILGVLGTWRVTHLLSAEDGPWKVFARLRRTLGQGFWADLFGCFYCLSLWVAIPFSAALGQSVKDYVLLWLALSGGAILLERVSARPDAIPPAIYFEDGDEYDGLLRKGSRVGGDGPEPSQ